MEIRLNRFWFSMAALVTVMICVILPLAGCREDELVVPTEYELLPIIPDLNGDIIGMYLLNEGNMGSNKASIDFVDFRNAYYVRNMYAERNPSVVKELGDVGNDIQIYGSRLYAVINCSHKVEVMDAYTLKRIGQIDIPNCRYIRFRRNRAYVSSYVGPVAIDPDAQQGAVYEVDTASLKVLRKCTVGYQPDELAIDGDYIYVANSGGYRVPNYDRTVSVVEIEGMKQVQKLDVGINLHRLKIDKYGQVWVSSRGNYDDVPSNLYVIGRKDKYKKELEVKDIINVPCSNMYIKGDSLYFYATEWSNQTETNLISYGIIDVRTHEIVTRNLITDGTDKDITIPYGIYVNPVNGDFYVTDAKNYVSSGALHCYDRFGRKKWSVRAGDIPAHMVILRKSNI